LRVTRPRAAHECARHGADDRVVDELGLAHARVRGRVGARRGDADVGAPVGHHRAHDLRVRGDQLDGELLARVEAREERGDERLGGRVARREPDDGPAVLDAGHHLADVVGGLEQRARVLIEPAPGGRQRDAARRPLEQARADLRLERGQALGQRRL
jgi:hypothetical protein